MPNQIFTPAEIVKIANDYSKRFNVFLKALKGIRASEKVFFANQSPAEDTSADMIRLIGEVQAIKAGIITDLTYINFLAYAIQIHVGFPPRYTSLDINATAGTLTANVSAGLTQAFNDGSGNNLFFINADAEVGGSDVISLSNCEDDANNGEYVLHLTTAPTGTVITLASAISGGVDNTSDESVIITLKERTQP